MSTHKADTQALDALTGGAFSAATSGERAARVRDWMAGNPSVEQMQEVFRELSARDKGAARPLREKLDEIRRAKGQEAIASEWAEKGRVLLEQPRLNIADALAWQRDAAKAGAPLSREPLAGVKTALAERVKGIEDLQHRVQVQREAAVLLAQRIEVLSTKPWQDAVAAAEALRGDVPEWQAQAQALLDDPNWDSVDLRLPPLLEASRQQLQAVWDAFQSALAQAAAAALDPAAPLPPVPVWADELRQARGLAAEPVAAVKPARPRVDPELRAKATQAVTEALSRLEQEIAQGHGKASAGAAAALRNALKEHGRYVDDKLESHAHAALAAATELEGWQRWRADQLRQELVAQAEALFEEPAPAAVRSSPRPAAVVGMRAPAAPGETAAPAPAEETPEPASLADAAAPAARDTTPVPAADDEVFARAAEEGQAATPAGDDIPVADEETTALAAGDETPAAAADAATQALAAGDETPAAAADAATQAPVAVDATPEPAAGGETPVRAAEGKTRTRGANRESRARAAAGEAPPPPRPRYGGRKMQEQLRLLRERWKQVDQGGPPNHALWKRFDEACNRAYEVVQAWLDKVKAEAAENRSKRLALVDELKAWAAAHAGGPADGDWKAYNRALHQFADRWREAGHLSEKAFAELQPLWREAFGAASSPLEEAQKASVERRQAMIAEAEALGAAPQLRIDAVKALQQRWQAEAQSVPLDRKQEQRLWDTFRKPIDEAFNRKTTERERAASAVGEHDRRVFEAARALEAATASGDAQKIRAAMAALDQATRDRGDATAAAGGTASPAAAAEAPSATAQPAEETVTAEGSPPAEAAAPAAAPKPAARPVVAVRGDDRPGAKRPGPEPAFAQRGRPDARRGPGAGRPGERPGDRRGGDRFGDRPAGDRRDERRDDRGPRLGDVAFRAQRDAYEHAQAALRKLAAQAHGEALSQLMAAWEKRDPAQVPGQQELGKSVAPPVRAAWVQAVGAAPAGEAGDALLRLEIAAEVPTPADQLSARRLLQLQLLTRRNEPAPQQTWGQDAARVFASAYDAGVARRVQNALKVLLRG